MPQVELVKDAEYYFHLLNCKSTNVKSIQFVNDQCTKVYYTHGEEFVPTSDRTNVVIAAFTTAQAPLKLYSVLKHLQMRTLYLDTDLMIFTIRPGEWVLPLGDFLGKLTNKLNDKDDITTFVSGGKLCLSNKRMICKVCGFTLYYSGSQKLNFSTMCKQMWEQRINSEV